MTRPGVLSPDARAAAIAAMTGSAGEPELDVLVVGGGVVGTGVALDAVTRGLSVGLLEQRDLASGTSSRSSKLIHGGLRYLEMMDFALVREALQERGLLLTRLAPHLVRPVPFLYPLTHPVWERGYVGSGLALYDGMALAGPLLHGGGGMGLPRHRHLTRRTVSRIAPDFRTDTITGAIQYWDAQVDDARLVVAIARTAARHGAQLATRMRVTGFLREGERVVGVIARDLERGTDHRIRAKTVVNAAGVWTDEIQELVGGRGALHVQASKGIHLVVPRDRIRSESGFIVRTEKSVLFVIPWGRHWIIGTTDTPWTYDLAHPAASRADIEYVLEHVNAILREPLGHEDVEGVYAGLRPLLSGESEPTSKISREHTVVTPVPGLVMIAGGKLTTYRVMAKDAVDAAVHSLRTTTDLHVQESITDKVRLLGDDLGHRPARAERAVRVLEDHLHARPHRPHFLGSERREVAPFDSDAAIGGLDQPQQQPSERGFAAAGFADQSQRLAALHRERYAVDGADAPGRPREGEPAAIGEGLAELGDGDEVFARAHDVAPAVTQQAADWPGASVNIGGIALAHLSMRSGQRA